MATLLLLFQLIACACFAAVVPDGDQLPGDVGAPPLPGGRRDTLKGKSASSSPSASPTTASPSAPPSVAVSPAAGTSSGSHKGEPGKSATPKHPSDVTSASAWIGQETPSTSYYLLGVVLIAFIVWVGLKSRRGERED